MNRLDENEPNSLRKNTDESLRGERSQTDEYLNEKNRVVTSEAEAMISADRAVADDKRRVSREKVDIELAHESGTAVGSNGAEDKNLTLERKRSDAAQTLERQKEDSVRKKERFQKRLIAEALLEYERNETDTDLLDERDRIDIDSKLNADLLVAEKELHEIAKVAIQARDQFLAIVSHDLKNPLGSIAMSADIIRGELNSPHYDTGTLLEYVDIIDRNAATMERMINDLLDAERIGQGKLTIEPTRLNISSLIEECKTLFNPVAAKKSFQITVTPSDLNLTAEIDHDRILQVLSNLLGNAVKFSPAGSHIAISAHAVGTDIEFSVKDNGPGISPDAQLTVFDRFSQIKSKDRRGLGLGLFISKWIVEAHHGKIWVESKLGQGSDFKFLVPAFSETPSH